MGIPMAPDADGSTTTPADVPAVRTEQLTKRLRNGIVAVDHLDLTVGQGRVLGLVGPNGSGKTITLRILLGLVRPTSGRALLFGQEVRPGAAVLGRVGALVDGPGFVPHLSGRQNLELAARQIERSGRQTDLERAVALSHLGHDVDRPVSGYSHGMGYRLALAHALLDDPDLLLLDEPTTGMDPAQIDEVHGAITACAAAGTTILLSTHRMSEIELVCTDVAVMHVGPPARHRPGGRGRRGDAGARAGRRSGRRGRRPPPAPRRLRGLGPRTGHGRRRGSLPPACRAV